MSTEILAWHFVRDGKLRDGTPVEVGRKLTYTDPLIMCTCGFHASIRAIDALKYAPGAQICRVRCGGEIIHDADKLVARERTALWTADARRTLHEFACDVAEDALSLMKQPDPRSVAAIAAKRAWLRGEIDDAVLAIASTAARDAARDAAWDAGWAAAWAAAWDAASAAARDAAWAAGWAAGRAAARDAAWAKQNDTLTARLLALGPEGVK